MMNGAVLLTVTEAILIKGKKKIIALTKKPHKWSTDNQK
jgi:hypothetical protein